MHGQDDRRPDPERLLRQLDQGPRPRGRLRVYFGASAGVGKTYAMLAAAQARHRQGGGVLVGVVETHGRKETEALLDGLDVLPLETVEYRGHALREFDLDGALARAPALVLVDELAHSNAPGSRHAKRWQDVQELAEAGIDVWTTLNVQHLDKLNEAVGSITGVRVWETVPDAVFDAADEVILVDLPADELLRRLKQGKVYLPEQARQAAGNFFRKGNLIALRELALRRTADHVDDAVQAYRLDREIDSVWRTREAVAACIAADDNPEYVVRGAHRLAQQLDAELHVVTVDPVRASARVPSGHAALQAAMALAESLGARTETLPGGDMTGAVARYARRHNVTKIVLGRHRRRRLPTFGGLLAAALAPGWMLHRHSFADLLAAACPGADVIRMGAPPHPAAPAPGGTPLTLGRRAQSGAEPEGGRGNAAGYLWALAYCAVAAGISALLLPLLRPANIVMLFLLAVVAVALRHGRGPAALASLVSVGLFDYFFVQPYESFAVSDIQYLLTFIVLLGVGLLIGQLTAGLRLQAQFSIRRAAQAQGLYEFARELSSALQAEQIVDSARGFVQATFGARCAVYLLDNDDRLALATPTDSLPGAASAPGTAGGTPGGPAPGAGGSPGILPLDTAVAQWVLDHGKPAGAGTTTLSDRPLRYLPLRAPMRTRGVLAVEPRPPGPGGDALSQRQQLEACATLIAIGLERLHYVEVAQRALVHMESERLRNALLAAMSHDLRTPLTGLVGMTETLLRRPGRLDGEVLETIGAMRDQARRMHALVANLLDMARLQSLDTPLRMQWQSIEELVGAALAAMREPLRGHRVTVGKLSALPLVECDGVLIERVLCNLLENAAKYTPPGSHIHVDAEAGDGELRVTVADDGPGVPPGAETRIFEKFTRGERESATPGVGLGLAVCRAIVDAHRGRIRVEPAGPPPARGARFVFTLPLGAPPAVQPEPT
ncbi:sensor histidine kinase KdpD [Pigmentiphaga soli]|uniref:histidine kinase n=1 Tax=Pigmentiphaga soli TaxID=1007095 RepID=A0ABP8GK10_9BURK